MERLLDAWEEHRGSIVDLWGWGLHGSEAIFIFNRDDTPREYDAWLRDLFTTANSANKEVLARVGLVLAQGPSLRDRLRRDLEFRVRFRDGLWPSLNRIATEKDRPLAVFAAHPSIWDLLRLPKGEDLCVGSG